MILGPCFVKLIKGYKYTAREMDEAM